MVEEGPWACGRKPPALYLCDFAQARDEIKSSKGISDRDGSHQHISNEATLEGEMREDVSHAGTNQCVLCVRSASIFTAVYIYILQEPLLPVKANLCKC